MNRLFISNNAVERFSEDQKKNFLEVATYAKSFNLEECNGFPIGHKEIIFLTTMRSDIKNKIVYMFGEDFYKEYTSTHEYHLVDLDDGILLASRKLVENLFVTTSPEFIRKTSLLVTGAKEINNKVYVNVNVVVQSQLLETKNAFKQYVCQKDIKDLEPKNEVEKFVVDNLFLTKE